MPEDGLFTGVIAKDSCMAFPFETLINVAEPGEYNFELFTSLEGDGDSSSDTFSFSFIHTFLLPFEENFDDQTLPERWFSDEVDPFFNFLGTETVSSVLDPLNSRFELTTARYGRIRNIDTLSFDYVFTSIDPTVAASDLVVGDQLLVEISTDCGENFTLLDMIDMVDVNPNDGNVLTNVNIPLVNFTDELVTFRFTALRGGTDFRIVLDNINILECLDDPFNLSLIHI